MGRVVVVGLGPGDPTLVTAGALSAIASIPPERRWLRTTRHPSAELVGDAASFDAHYEQADTFEQVYEAIVADLVAASERHGEVLYAVPGSPRVLERTVDLLDAEAAAGRIDLEVHGALSFVDLAWVRLGIDPYEQGVRLVDGHRFEALAAGEASPMLVAHCHNQRILSDIKLAVDDPPEQPVVILQRLGLPDETITEVAWADLDRTVDPDHLTSVYLPPLGTPVAGEVAAFVELVATLRQRCPWDAEQTHATLTRHLLEETYEVLEALDAVGEGGEGTEPEAYIHLEEELGDLLFQIVFHAELASEAGAFGFGDVARGVHDKLVSRHPHVFGQVEVEGSEDVVANWEEIKKAEKGRTSVFDGIPPQLPALLYATKVIKKAAALGVQPDGGEEAVEVPGDDADRDIGRELLEVVARARAIGVDPEQALRIATNQLRHQASQRE